MRPFRFGVQISTAADGAAFRARARAIEDMGYTSLLMPDHFGDQWDPSVALTVAADATTSLKVGALVFDNDYRHPVVLAKQVATLDLVSGGRVEFGIGAGWMRSDYEQSGIAYDSPGTRIDRLEEALQIIKALWADGSATYAGTHYQVTEAQGQPRPVSQPHPPVIIGGGGRRILELAAREADIVGVNPNLRAGEVGPDTIRSAVGPLYRERLGWIREAAGDRFDQLELQCLVGMVQLTDDRQEVLRNVAPMFGVTPEEADEIPLALVGTEDEIVDCLERRRADYGISYIVVQDAGADALAPVVARLAGA